MNVALENDPAFVVAMVGASIIVILIVGIGFQLFGSARTAKMHLERAATLDALGAGNVADSVRNAPNITHQSHADAARGVLSDSIAQSPAMDRPAAMQTIERLNQYYAANINQGTAIFWASLMSMSIGFATIFVAILTVRTNSTVAIAASISGILSQFIAATFLVALRSTQQQSTTYAQSLAEMQLREARATADAQSVLLGLRLLGEISSSSTDSLANHTRAALATGLILKQAVTPVTFSPVIASSLDDDDTAMKPRNENRARAQSVTFDAGRIDESQRVPEKP